MYAGDTTVTTNMGEKKIIMAFKILIIKQPVTILCKNTSLSWSPIVLIWIVNAIYKRQVIQWIIREGFYHNKFHYSRTRIDWEKMETTWKIVAMNVELCDVGTHFFVGADPKP